MRGFVALTDDYFILAECDAASRRCPLLYVPLTARYNTSDSYS